MLNQLGSTVNKTSSASSLRGKTRTTGTPTDLASLIVTKPTGNLMFGNPETGRIGMVCNSIWCKFYNREMTTEGPVMVPQ